MIFTCHASVSPSLHSTQKRRQQLHLFGSQLQHCFDRVWQGFRGPLGRLWSKLSAPWTKLFQRDATLAVSLLLLLSFWVILIFTSFILPGSYVFEGNLTTQSLSFTHTGPEKLFLDTVTDIKTFDLSGQQSTPLTLTGKFSSPSDPALNQKLQSLQELNIELPSSISRFRVASTTTPSPITLFTLRLQSQVRVQDLAYQAQANQLSLCLQAASALPRLCQFPDSIDPAQTQSSNEMGAFSLQLGTQPLNITLEMANLSQLGLTADPNDPNAVQFDFIPAVNEIQFQTLSPTQLRLELPPVSNLETMQINEPLAWIRDDIDVTDVEFVRSNFTNEAQDTLDSSTILAGEVRMGSETLAVKPRQYFIVLSRNPGIRKLRSIHLKLQAPTGLETLFTGESRGIAVGLYPQFPVQKIQPSWLSRYFSPEGISALLAFVSALTGILLPRLFFPSKQ